MPRRLWLPACALIAACYGNGSIIDGDAGTGAGGDTGADRDGGGRPSTDTGTGSDTGPDRTDAADASTEPDDSGTPEPTDPVPLCTPTCASDADCPTDQYACTGGLCVFGGCRSDAECAALGDYVCHADGAAPAVCVQACATAADCGTGPESGPYGPDNYDCADGACAYRGCRTDAECATLGDFGCFDFGAQALCAAPCTTASDCVYDGATPAYDLDNYACESGRCTYTGCRDSAECAALGSYACAVIELSPD